MVFNVSVLKKAALGAHVVCVFVLLFAFSGCQRDEDRTVSAGSFFGPVVRSDGISVLADKLSFFRAMQPGKLDSEFTGQTAEVRILGRLSCYDYASGATRLTDELLAYEGLSKCLLTVNVCPPSGSTGGCGAVRLCYNQAGMDEAQSAQGGVTAGGHLSTAVPPITLKNGWILAYDMDSKNIVALRCEAQRQVDLGAQTSIGYRTFERTDTTSKNFGRGNGLLLSLVISGANLSRQMNISYIPTVTRMFEFAENKILLFCAGIDKVYMLELREEAVDWPWDLNEPTNARKRLPTIFLRGEILTYPMDPDNPKSPRVPHFIESIDVSLLTGNASVILDKAQPITIPGDTSALVFEQASSQFFKLSERKRINPGSGQEEVLGGKVEFAIRSNTLLAALMEASGGASVSTPLEFGALFPHPKLSGLCMFEERSNSLLLYDYASKDLRRNIRVLVKSANVISPRTSSGPPAPSTGNEPILVFATGDVQGTRLAFDRGQDHLLGIHYATGIAIVTATRETLTAYLGSSVVELSYVEPIDENEIRAFDTQSSKLLRMRVVPTPFPLSF